MDAEDVHAGGGGGTEGVVGCGLSLIGSGGLCRLFGPERPEAVYRVKGGPGRELRRIAAGLGERQERVADGGRVGRTVRRVLGQQAVDEPGQLLRYFLTDQADGSRGVADVLLAELVRPFTDERGHTREHLVQHAAQRVEVGGRMRQGLP